MKVGVNVAIIEDGKVLLTKREDFGVWCLPGGGVDDGESIGEAAVREAVEETGLEVKLKRLIGIYSMPEARAWANLIVAFVGEAVGGSLKAQAGEVLERFDEFCCPVCKGDLGEYGGGLVCGSFGRRYEVVNGVPDFFVGDVGRDFVTDPNRTWLEPEIVEARDTIYRLCTRELVGMAFCMAEIGKRIGANGRILEAGMGTGHFTRWIRESVEAGVRIYAFDFSWPIIEKAKVNTAGLDNIVLFRANARGPLPFRDSFFAGLFLRLVPLGTPGTPNVKAGFRLLRPGGWYFEAGWESSRYETPPTDWAMAHGFERAEHHVWRYRRLQTAEERAAWAVEGDYLRKMGKAGVRFEREGEVVNGDGSMWKMTVENLLMARRPEGRFYE